MKNVSLAVVFVLITQYTAFAQTDFFNIESYFYVPREIDTNFNIKCVGIEKVFCRSTKTNTQTLRLLENKRFEQLWYSKNKRSIVSKGGFYKISKKNVLYLNSYKVPNWTNYKKCIKYKINDGNLYKVLSKNKNVADKPDMLATTDNNFYRERNYNAVRREYWFGNLARGTHKFSNASCSTGHLSASKYVHQKFIDATKKFFPEYESIITNSYAAPESYQKRINNQEVKFKIDTSENFLNDILLTVLHESIHQKNYELSSDSTFAYYISKNKIVKTNINLSYYKSQDIIEVIDTNELYNFSFHAFDMVLSYLLKQNISSNVNGIYGLLDEFSAYAHAAKANLLACEQMQNLPKNKLRKICTDNAYDIPTTYFSFNIMIGWYLDYAVKHRPELVSTLESDLQLREAFTSINQLFEQQIEIYNKQVELGILPANFNYSQRNYFEVVLSTYQRLKPLLDNFKI